MSYESGSYALRMTVLICHLRPLQVRSGVSTGFSHSNHGSKVDISLPPPSFSQPLSSCLPSSTNFRLPPSPCSVSHIVLRPSLSLAMSCHTPSSLSP
ncbi:hypothetical protein Pmani_009990 [Petrolisthes manimaculis]|uniref:Uncharacterized protein n=1 Tax=Petrolisthes manimaculis TaxID=1843537 RepID=A0AAE1Q353_9EUCA|nr:hypothetical protein Pmani_009990 [Petrolisthes manimaculis]